MKNAKKSLIIILAVFAMLLPSTAFATDNEEELRGIWVATVYGLDFPKTDTAAEQKQELIDIVNNAAEHNLNAIFFQVRPHSDAFYSSDVYPWSKYLAGGWGVAPSYDPLAFLIETASAKGIEVHAWINPYRIASGSHDLDALPDGHPAKENPNLVIKYDDGNMYFDPGNPQSMEIVLSGIQEIVDNYDVDGIHFDDYFYPSPNVTVNGESVKGVFDDAATYAVHNGGLTLEDWRRQNTYNLIANTNALIESSGKDVEFGVSPPGIWDNEKDNPLGSNSAGYSTYSMSYADTRLWVKDEILDYIAPQIYWTFDNQAAPYGDLVEWWSDVVTGTDVKLYIGHALYMAGGSGSWADISVIPQQIELNRSLGNVSGSILYRYAHLIADTNGAATAATAMFTGDVEVDTSPTVDLPQHELAPLDGLLIAYPYSGYSTTGSKSYIIGAGIDDVPIYLNGVEIPRTENGFFAQYVSLQNGANNFTFEHNGVTTNFSITKSTGGGTSAPYIMYSPEVYAPKPSSTMYYRLDENFTMSCIAPSGISVTATLDGKTYQLQQGATVASQGIPCSTYSITVAMPEYPNVGVTNLGKPVFTFTYDGTTYTGTAAGEVQAYMVDPTQVAVINADNTTAREGNSTSYDRMTPLSAGTTDYVVRETPTYYQLSYGGYVLKEDTTTIADTLPTNVITSLSGASSEKSTVMRFKMPVSAPHTIKEGTNTFEITFHNTYVNEKLLIPIVQSNPLFSNIEVFAQGSDVTYIFTTKQANWLFGYDISFTNGYFKIDFNNPPTLADGAYPLAGHVIGIDIGHNWGDPGATGPLGAYGPREAELNQVLGEVIIEKLEALGAEIVLSKTSSNSIPDRVDVLQDADPVVSISLHHNSVGTTTDVGKVFGAETLYSNDMSMRFAEVIQDNLIAETGGVNRGAKKQSLIICRVQKYPAVLIEFGFSTNPYEYENLIDGEYILKEAEGVVNGVLEFLDN